MLSALQGMQIQAYGHYLLSTHYQAYRSRLKGNAPDLSSRFVALLILAMYIAMIAEVSFYAIVPGLFVMWGVQALEMWFLYEKLPDARAIAAQSVVQVVMSFFPRFFWVGIVANFFAIAQPNDITVDHISKKHPTKQRIFRFLLETMLTLSVIGCLCYSTYALYPAMLAGTLGVQAVCKLLAMYVAVAHYANALTNTGAKGYDGLMQSLLFLTSLFGFEWTFTGSSLCFSAILLWMIDKDHPFLCVLADAISLVLFSLHTLFSTLLGAIKQSRLNHLRLQASKNPLWAVGTSVVTRPWRWLTGRLFPLSNNQTRRQLVGGYKPTDYSDLALSEKALSSANRPIAASEKIHPVNIEIWKQEVLDFFQKHEVLQTQSTVHYQNKRSQVVTFQIMIEQVAEVLADLEQQVQGQMKEDCQYGMQQTLKQLSASIANNNIDCVKSIIKSLCQLHSLCAEGVHQHLSASFQVAKGIESAFLSIINGPKQAWLDEKYVDMIDNVEMLRHLWSSKIVNVVRNNQSELACLLRAGKMQEYFHYVLYIGSFEAFFQNSAEADGDKKKYSCYQEQHSKNVMLHTMRSVIVVADSYVAEQDTVVKSNFPVYQSFLVPDYLFRQGFLHFIQDRYGEDAVATWLLEMAKTVDYSVIEKDLIQHLNEEYKNDAVNFRKRYAVPLSRVAPQLLLVDDADKDDIPDAQLVKAVNTYLQLENEVYTRLSKQLRGNDTSAFRKSYQHVIPGVAFTASREDDQGYVADSKLREAVDLHLKDTDRWLPSVLANVCVKNGMLESKKKVEFTFDKLVQRCITNGKSFAIFTKQAIISTLFDVLRLCFGVVCSPFILLKRVLVDGVGACVLSPVCRGCWNGVQKACGRTKKPYTIPRVRPGAQDSAALSSQRKVASNSAFSLSAHNILVIVTAEGTSDQKKVGRCA